jgi:hypothetical protein
MSAGTPAAGVWAAMFTPAAHNINNSKTLFMVFTLALNQGFGSVHIESRKTLTCRPISLEDDLKKRLRKLWKTLWESANAPKI